MYFQLLVDTILQIYSSWFLGLSLKTSTLLTMFPSHSWFHRYSFNEQIDYYQRIICVSNAATWGKTESNLTGTSGNLSFGFSITLSWGVFFLYSILCAAFNQLGREIGIAVEKCSSPANFHCCGLQWAPLWKLCTASSLGFDPAFSRDGITLQNWLPNFVCIYPDVRAGFSELDFQNCVLCGKDLRQTQLWVTFESLSTLNLNI